MILVMLLLNALVDKALEYGFSYAAILDAATLNPRKEVFDMCADNRCGNYNKSWMCPPASGNPEQNLAKLSAFSKGIIVQTTGKLDDDFDYEGMKAASDKHMQLFNGIVEIIKRDYPHALFLGSGGCKLCESCTYPDLPCRYPELAFPSMEAFGLIVSDVCTANGAKYYYGPQTITYTGCILIA